MVESALVILVYLATLVSIFDFAQILFFHNALVDRARAGARWAVVRPFDEAAIANKVVYGTEVEGERGFLGLTPANVRVELLDAANENRRIRVSIVNFRFFFFSPWIAKSFTKGTAVVQVLPYEIGP